MFENSRHSKTFHSIFRSSKRTWIIARIDKWCFFYYSTKKSYKKKKKKRSHKVLEEGEKNLRADHDRFFLDGIFLLPLESGDRTAE